MDDSQSTYFAAKDPASVANVCLSRSNTFFNNQGTNDYLRKLINNWRAYHGNFSENNSSGHEVTFAGEQGELTQIPVNNFRNLARHTLNIITSNRPTMQARAINTDYKSLSQTYLANGVLDYYMREKGLERALKSACEMAIVLGSGYMKLEWNATAGEQYDIDPETGEPNYEGEIEFSNLSPFDVVMDGTKETWDNDWLITRSFQNRFNLMAKYPEMKDKLAGIPSKSDDDQYRYGMFSNDETDDIPVYEFYHKKTEALPDGRYILFASPETIMLDTKLPYPEIPVYRIVPAEIMGTPYGYTDMFDVYPIQEAMNSLHTTILTNQNAFGVQNVFVQRGSDISVASLSGGLNIIEANSEPKPLNLTQTPAEIFKYLEVLGQASETISGINSVTRGNPEASLRSGTALALVQSMSLQFMSGLQQSYVNMIEDVGTALVKILQMYATTPKVIAIVGKNNRTFLKQFTGDEIEFVNRVVVDVGNPLARTTAGRVQMAEQMMQMGLITTPQEYFQVINTGNLDTMYEGAETELLLIKQENEQMMDGKTPIVSPIDSHKLHILEHRSVLADPDLREDPNLVKVVMDHIEAHLNALKNVDPSLLNLIGEQAIQPPPPPAPPGGPQGPGPGPGGPPPGPMGPPHPQGAPMPPGGQPPHPQAPPHGHPPMVRNTGIPGGKHLAKGKGVSNTLGAPKIDKIASGELIQGNELGPNGQRMPGISKIPYSLLPNPSLQEEAMGNVNFKK